MGKREGHKNEWCLRHCRLLRRIFVRRLEVRTFPHHHLSMPGEHCDDDSVLIVDSVCAYNFPVLLMLTF